MIYSAKTSMQSVTNDSNNIDATLQLNNRQVFRRITQCPDTNIHFCGEILSLIYVSRQNNIQKQLPELKHVKNENILQIPNRKIYS